MMSSRFDLDSISVWPQKPWSSLFYGSMNGPGLKTLASAMVWRLVCTFCHPSLVSYDVSHFLASHSLGPTPFEGWTFAWLWAFLPLAHSLALFCSLCISYRTTLLFLLWCYLTQACWASLGLLLILLLITQYSHLGFLVTLLVVSCVPFSF